MKPKSRSHPVTSCCAGRQELVVSVHDPYSNCTCRFSPKQPKYNRRFCLWIPTWKHQTRVQQEHEVTKWRYVNKTQVVNDNHPTDHDEDYSYRTNEKDTQAWHIRVKVEACHIRLSKRRNRKVGASHNIGSTHSTNPWRSPRPILRPHLVPLLLIHR